MDEKFNQSAMDLLLENEMGVKIVSMDDKPALVIDDLSGKAMKMQDDLVTKFKKLQKNSVRHQSTREMNRRLRRMK